MKKKHTHGPGLGFRYCTGIDSRLGGGLHEKTRTWLCLADLSRAQGETFIREVHPASEMVSRNDQNENEITPPSATPFFRRVFFRVGSDVIKTNRGFLPPTRSQTRLGLVVRCGGGA